MSLQFKSPTLDDKKAVLVFKDAYLSHYDDTTIHGSSELHRFCDDDFDKWLDYVYAPIGTNWFGYDKVASDTLLIYKDSQVVGIVNIRYDLTEFLLKIGGHIGYSTHPDFQGQGIANAALAYALDLLKGQSIDKALITCHQDNIGSSCVIQKNGGTLESVIEFDNKKVCRYWINLV